MNKLPDRSSENAVHWIVLTGSKWSWKLLLQKTTQELFRDRIDNESSWLAAWRALEKAHAESPTQLRLCLSRQFNWPTGVLAEQAVRIRLLVDSEVRLNVRLDGEDLEFRPDLEFLLSGPVDSHRPGARQLDVSLVFQDSGAARVRNPLRGVWLRIE